MKTKVWYKWPAGFYELYGLELLPWYQIVRRGLVFPLIVALAFIMAGLICLGFGKEDAARFLEATEVW